MIPNAAPRVLQRVILDTNVCLDLFVFDDPRWHLLGELMMNGELEALTRADCRMEFMLVLAYQRFGLSADSQANILKKFDQWIRLSDGPSSYSTTALPKCKDGDDQKFLELAQQSGADVLITKDKALLKLARKTIRARLFRIFSPEAWLASFVTNPDLSK